MAEVTKGIWPKQATCAILVGVLDAPQFAYPGGKARHAKRIVSLFPPVGDRFVDVFAGRGNLTWAVMSLLNYRRYWINAVGTYPFFGEIYLGNADWVQHRGRLYWLASDKFKDRTKEFYAKSRARTRKAAMQELITFVQAKMAAHPEIDFTQPVVPGTRLNVSWVDILNQTKERMAKETEEKLSLPLSPAIEGYVSRDGGTFDSTGPKGSGGGITKKGMDRTFRQAGLLLKKNWKRTKLTKLDYRDVLAQCRPGDMVYLDPPYRNANLRTYDTHSIDFSGLIKTLLRAPFRWVLSEYQDDDDFYRVLGDPILRIRTYKGTGEPAEECLWSNFEPNYLNERTTMRKLDTAKLLETMKRERDEIDAAIKIMNRTLQRNFAPESPTAKTTKRPTKKAPKTKGRNYTKAQREAMSEKIKAAWRRKKGDS